MNIILGNHFFTQESSLSRLHNELSKWSHSLNINQLSLLYKKDGKIKLSIENELNDFNVLFVKKYIEATYLLINEHSNMFYLQTFSKEYMSFSKEMISYYSKYITLFYKKE